MFVFPEPDKGFNMYTTLAGEFHKNGHEVYVLAPDNRHRKTEIRSENNINVLRVRTFPVKNVPNFIKGISNLLLPFQYNRAIMKHYPSAIFDLIITSTPPITLVDLAAKLKRKHNNMIYLILRDIFPQNAVDLGFIKRGSFIYRYFREKEKKLYKTADHIGCMSEGNINYLLSQNDYLNKNKLHLLPNFQKLNDSFPVKDLSILTKYGLQDKYVVIFGGNMGKPQQLENVIALAKTCQEYPDVIFLLLGEGVQKLRIEEMYKAEGIKNIVIIDTISKDEYQKLVGVCDIGLISLHADFTIPNIPSKTLDYFNMGIPVLASIDHSTDYWKLLDEAETGLWSYAGDLKSFKANFDKLYHTPDLRKQMGINARRYFESHLTPEKAYASIIGKLKEN